jgi:superfamily II DNA or RNA helicase
MKIEFQAGATVRARGGRFTVLSAESIAQTKGEPIRRLRLRALDEPFRNEEICVLHPIEDVEPDEIPELDLAQPGRLARFQLLMDAARLSLAPGDDRLVSSTRSRIAFEPYQQVPVLRALELPRPRLLIADDVGLGKTIEAGLILRELNARRRAARILIVCPASILEQWQTELASKFGFQFKIFDSEGVAEARRSLEAGSNPWSAEPRVIASVDFIKRREGAFRELSASRWDVIIIDEAHHLASGGNDDELTDRFRLARWLAAENTGALLLLTATPHDGYDQNFASLLSLLEPSLVVPGRYLRFDHYRRHMVRRMKRHVRMPDGSPKFVERKPVEPLPVELPAAEEQLQAAVREEAAALDLLAEKALRSDRENIRLVATILRKRAASSLAAIRKTVAQRKVNISQTIAEVEVRRDHLRAVRRGETIPEEAQARLERDLYRSYLSAMQRTGRELRRLSVETDRLDNLERLAAACGSGPEAKLLTLEAWLKALHVQEPEKKVIVFSEYADTVESIVAHLEPRGYSGRVVQLTGDTGGRADRAKALARFASPEARILVATDVAGEGLNLHEHCHHLVHFELPWNPNRMEQRNGRIDRYGQAQPPTIAFLYAQDSYEGEVLKRLVLKIEAQIRMLGSVGDVLGQIQADSIEQLLSRPVPDLHRAVAEAEAQIDSELNRASGPRVRAQIGEGGEDDDELTRADAAVRRERERGVALDVFLQRAVLAAGGAVERHGDALRVTTPQPWLSLEVHGRYESLLPPGSFSQGEETAAQDVLHEEHPLMEAAVHWVRSTRFRKGDDHRLASIVVPDLAEPDLIATFLITLQDGTAAKVERFEAVRISAKLEVSGDPISDEEASRITLPGNIPTARLQELFGAWWQQARTIAEAQASRRAANWKAELETYRNLEREGQKPEIDGWDRSTRDAILGDYARQAQQPRLFGDEPTLPPALRRRLDEHRKRVELQRSILDRRAHFEAPLVEPLGVLLRVPTSLIEGSR